MTLDSSGVWAAVDRQRVAVADLLEGLSDDEWALPSLCAGWTVRDVAGHLASQHTMPLRAAVGAMVRARGNQDRMIHDSACRYAERPTGVLVEEIRALVGWRRHVPVVGPLEVLTDLLVHGCDVAVPLGRGYPVPSGAALASVTRVWSAPWHLRGAFPSRRRYAGFRLVATDSAWSAGKGETVTAPIEVLLLLLAGRDSAALPRLDGEGAPALRARLIS
jgi:uncharacterized protein (TIGR03083 family)